MTWPIPPLRLDLAQRHHHRKGAIEPGDHVGERRRRQGRLAVRKSGARRVAGHALDQGAEAGPVAVGTALTPAGNPQNDETRVVPVQNLRPEPHRLERPRTEILDQHLGGGQEFEEQLAPARLAQAHRQALLVARIDLPVHADPVGLPGAQRVAALRILDLQHLRAEIGELQAHHVAGDQARHVDHPHPVERADRSRLERFFGHAHRRGPMLKAAGAASTLAPPLDETKGGGVGSGPTRRLTITGADTKTQLSLAPVPAPPVLLFLQ